MIKKEAMAKIERTDKLRALSWYIPQIPKSEQEKGISEGNEVLGRG